MRRQVGVLEDGGTVVQETRLYDADRGETRPMRSKEDAQDYRYFPDPDLLPLAIDEAWKQRVRASMGELPQAVRERFARDYGLGAQECAQLTTSREMAAYYERLVRASGSSPRLAATWMAGELAAALNRAGLEAANSPVSPERLAGLLRRIEDRTISARSAKEVFDAMWEATSEADEVIALKGLKQICDEGALEAAVAQAIAANPKLAEDYRAGRQKAFNALVGQVMKATRGRADPARVNDLLRKKI